jgi:hypothetical protein
LPSSFMTSPSSTVCVVILNMGPPLATDGCVHRSRRPAAAPMSCNQRRSCRSARNSLSAANVQRAWDLSSSPSGMESQVPTRDGPAGWHGANRPASSGRPPASKWLSARHGRASPERSGARGPRERRRKGVRGTKSPGVDRVGVL